MRLRARDWPREENYGMVRTFHDHDSEKRHMNRNIFCATFVAFLLAAQSTSQAASWSNPVWPDACPDPTFWQAPDGTWRCASTAQSILKSTDFFRWEDTGKRLFTDEEYARIRKNWAHIWAPDMFKLGDEYLLFISLVNRLEDSAIAVYSSKDPEGPFTDGRILTKGRDTGINDTIDPEAVRDETTGDLWLFFGSVGKVHRVKLAPDGKSLAPGAAYEHMAGVHRERDHNPSRSKVFEGTYLHRRGGWWYLFASRGRYTDYSYAVVVGRARTLAGPFLDREGRAMKDGFATTVVSSDKGDRFFGPGHNGEIVTIDGHDYLPYHCHIQNKTPNQRPLFIQELFWDDEGWPYVGNNGKPQPDCRTLRPVQATWGKPVDLGPGGYARIRRLADGRYMAAYAHGGNMTIRFSMDTRTWTSPQVAASRFEAGANTNRIFVNLANAEFAQLPSGRIVLACNLRPAGKRADVHPFSIGLVTSDDAGASWSKLRVIYRSENISDGVQRGCWEPFVLPGKGGRVQIYFADEAPYVDGKRRYQNISVIESSDAGKTWGPVRVASYNPRCRDGMPVVLQMGDWRWLALETNGKGTRLHPEIVRSRVADNWSVTVGSPSPDRFSPFLASRDWRNSYGGAPYIAATKNYVLLSWQETSRVTDDELRTAVVRVAAVPKDEISDGRFTTMRVLSVPPLFKDAKDGTLWNSLCPLDGDAFLLVSQYRNRIVVHPCRLSP